ncbi:MAG TPA: hypothetical protein VF808_08110 [Ktedonobacterales bacterium]
MNLFRGVAAILVFLVGLITIAGALFGVGLTAAAAQVTHQPINLSDLATGLIAGAIGFLCLFISRAIDPERGPVLSYSKRRRKRRAHS